MSLLTFADQLKLIEDRSAALRAAAAQAGHDALVPGCPDWTVCDLITHLGEVHRAWAAVVTTGPATSPPDEVADAEPGDDLIGWSVAATAELIRALTEAGPDRPCWTWWRETGAAATSGAVARHQVQEAAVHAFDAQEAAGQPEPLPGDVAADGVGEFLSVGMATMGPWPHQPGRVVLDAIDGPSWLVDLSQSGARVHEAQAGDAAAAWVRGTASDLVLSLYGRNLQQGLDIEGDHELATGLLGWADNE